MKHVNLLKGIKAFLFFLTLTLNFAVFAVANSETITTIILIDRVAELVELTEDGEVLQRHLAVPDYFSSGRSHNTSLKQSLAKLKDYGYQENFELPGSSDLSSSELQSYMTTKRKVLDSLTKKDLQISKRAQINEKWSDQSFIEQHNNANSATILRTRIDRLKLRSHNEQAASFLDVFYPRLEDSHLKQRDFHLIRSYNSDIAKAYI